MAELQHPALVRAVQQHQLLLNIVVPAAVAAAVKSSCRDPDWPGVTSHSGLGAGHLDVGAVDSSLSADLAGQVLQFAAAAVWER